MSLVGLWWWSLPLLSLFCTYSGKELVEPLSLGHCAAAGSGLQLEGETRGWKMQVVMEEASEHQELEGCGIWMDQEVSFGSSGAECSLLPAKPAQDAEALGWVAMLRELEVGAHRLGAGHGVDLDTFF